MFPKMPTFTHMASSFPLWILGLVLAASAVRKIGPFRFSLWQVMTAGAILVLAAQSISISNAFKAIDLNVLVYLFGVFITAQALEDSGRLQQIAYRIFRHARTADELLLALLFVAGPFSAFLMNDTLAIVGAPVVLLLARRHKISPKLFLLALAFAVTTGSIMSPVGNPQNLLIVLKTGMSNPFLVFLRKLGFPTFLSLGLAYLVLRGLYPQEFGKDRLTHDRPPVLHDAALARLANWSLGLLCGLIGLKIILALNGQAETITLPSIALTSALPVLLLSPRRIEIARRIDWQTLLFFAAMFILMQSVWDTGFFQEGMRRIDLHVEAPQTTLSVGLLASQLVSNVPLVALYLPLLAKANASQAAYLALAAGSTLAGNLFILGAASNVIIIENAEKKHAETIGFLEFARAGIPLTLLQTGLYWLFLQK